MVKDIFFFGMMLFVVYGYFSYLHYRFQIYEEFLPIIVFSGITGLIFIAGILNIMEFVWVLIVAIGGILAIWSIKKREYCKITIGLGCLLFLTFYLLLFLKEQIFLHYDNFSHWGMVVKSICRESRFPNFEDSTITFQAYPVGSACFIWFVCKFLGYTEGHALFAQAMLIISCIGPLFAFGREEEKTKKLLIAAVALLGGMILTSFGSDVWPCLHNLLVDSLLSAIAIAAFSIIFLYRDRLKTAVWCVLPLLILEVCVKNSGIMWVAAITMEIIYFSQKQLVKKELTKYILVLLSVTGGYIFLWKQHTALVFANAANAKHSMSLENYREELKNKSVEDISYICKKFLERCFSMSDELVQLIICLLIVLIFIRIFYKHIYKSSHMVFCFIYCLAVSIIYQAGNLAMYIFSMPPIEASKLAGYERYIITLEMFILGIIVVMFLQFIKQAGREQKWYLEWKGIVISFVFIVGIIWNGKTVKEWTVHPTKTDSDRVQMDAIIATNNLEERKKSLIYIADENDGGYRWYISKYLLWSDNVETVNTENIKRLNDFEQYDYLIILDKDPEVAEWLIANGFTEFTKCIKTSDVEYVKASTVIKNLKSENYMSIISVKDDASTAFTDELASSMHEIGLQHDLIGAYRQSYLAIIDGENIVYEALGNERLEYAGNLDGVQCEAVSAGFNGGNESRIILNGTDYSNNTRGINIVVYDKVQKEVIGAITFDTWMHDGHYVMKEELNN